MENQTANQNGFVNDLMGATIHFLYSIAYFLFIVPLDLWRNAVKRLALQRANGTMKLTKIEGLWPLLSYIKTLMFEFFFDAIIFVWYFIGAILAIVALAQDGFGAFIASLIAAYYSPIMFSFFRDLAQMSLLPIRKFLSWCRKPAQQLDIDFKNRD